MRPAQPGAQAKEEPPMPYQHLCDDCGYRYTTHCPLCKDHNRLVKRWRAIEDLARACAWEENWFAAGHVMEKNGPHRIPAAPLLQMRLARRVRIPQQPHRRQRALPADLPRRPLAMQPVRQKRRHHLLLRRTRPPRRRPHQRRHTGRAPATGQHRRHDRPQNPRTHYDPPHSRQPGGSRG